MIKKIKIANFQSIVGPAIIDIKPITILCGPNSSGKSAIIDLIEYYQTLGDLKDGVKNAEVQRAVSEKSKEGFGKFASSVEIEIDPEEPSTNGHLSSPDGKKNYRFDSYTNLMIELGASEESISSGLRGKTITLEYDRNSKLEICINGERLISIFFKVSYFNYNFEIIEGLGDDGFDKDGYDFEGFNSDGKDRSGNSLGEGAEHWPGAHLGLVGEVRINKQNPMYEEYFTSIPERPANYAMRKLFYAESADEIVLRGFYMSGLNPIDSGQFPKSTFLSPCVDVGYDIGEYSNAYKEAYSRVKSRGEAGSWLPPKIKEREFTAGLLGSSVRDVADELESYLWGWCDMINFTLESVFLRYKSHLTFNQVGGGRGLISTNTPYIWERSNHKDEKNHVIDLGTYSTQVQDLLMDYEIAYEEECGEGILGYGRLREELLQRIRFVDFSLANLLPSLGRYEFRPQILRITEESSSWTPGGTNVSSQQSAPELRSRLIARPFLYSENLEGGRIDFANVGSGLSFVLPIISAVSKPGLTVIEQPELHLHPRAQCELGDLFIAAMNTRGSTLLIETHSEHCILRLSRRIRETTRGSLIQDHLKLSPDEVSIYYFKPNGDGTTSVHPIRFDSQGDFLDLWPDGFFAERAGELFDE